MSKLYKGLIGAIVAISLSLIMTGCPGDAGRASSMSRIPSSSTAPVDTSSSENLSSRNNSALESTRESSSVQGKAFANSTASEKDAPIVKNDSTGIPDKAFYQAILKTAVGKKEIVDQNKDGILQKSEIKRIPRAVYWDNKGIKSLQGIENLPVSEIHLNGNKISDITPVAKLAGNVKTGEEQLSIELKNNRITSLKPFGIMMGKLKSSPVDTLDLSNNLISDISYLKNVSVKILNLSHNQVKTADSFFSNNQSFSLDLSDNQISSLGTCQSLAYSINLSHNKISSIKSLSGPVEELDLSNNSLSSVAFLKQLKSPGPSKLNLSNNKISALPDMKKWGWTKLTPEKDGQNYLVTFEHNYLTESEFRTQLPVGFLSRTGKSANNSEKWLKDQVGAQIKK